MGKRTAQASRGRYVTASDIAEQLFISQRQAERLMAEGAFGPRLRIGYRTMRVQQAGVDAYVRRLERDAAS